MLTCQAELIVIVWHAGIVSLPRRFPLRLKERFMALGVMLGYAALNYALVLLFHSIMTKFGGGYSDDPFLPKWRAAGVLIFLALQWLSTFGVFLWLLLGIIFFIRPEWAIGRDVEASK